MKYWVKVVTQIFFLWLFFKAGSFLVSILHLPVPGNVMGMLLLFFVLSMGIIPSSWIEEGAGILLKHLAFFFIPIAVGLMVWGPLIKSKGLILLAALVLSAAVCLAVTGYVVQVLTGKEREPSQ